MKIVTLILILYCVHGQCQNDTINRRNDDGEKTGRWLTFTVDSVLIKDCFFDNDTLNGICKSFYSDGKLNLLESYKMGVLNGYCESYWPNSQLLMSGSYVDGELDGLWCTFDSLGNLIERAMYHNGIFDETYDSLITTGPIVHDNYSMNCDTASGYEYKDKTKEIIVYCNGIISSRSVYEKHGLVLKNIFVNGEEIKRIVYRKHGKNRIKRVFFYENEKFSHGEIYRRNGQMKRKVYSPL